MIFFSVTIPANYITYGEDLLHYSREYFLESIAGSTIKFHRFRLLVKKIHRNRNPGKFDENPASFNGRSPGKYSEISIKNFTMREIL